MAITNYCAWATHPDNELTVTSTDLSPASTLIYGIYADQQVLAQLPISKTLRWQAAQSDSELSEVYISEDFGSAKTIGVAALVGHNFSEDAVVSVKGGTTSAVTDYNASIPWRERLMFKVIDPAQSYRYWRITVSDPTNADGFLELGYLLLAPMTLPNFTYRQDWTDADDVGVSEVRSEFGTPYIEALYERKALQLAFGPLTTAQATELQTLAENVRGATYPMLIVPERGGTEAYFGRIQSVINERMDFRHYIDLTFVEESYGSIL